MTTVGEIYQEIDRWAPFATAMEFDNPGLLVGDPETPVEKVLLALDITAAEAAEAASLGCGLIVSHHPVIFHPLRRLGTQDAPCWRATVSRRFAPTRTWTWLQAA